MSCIRFEVPIKAPSLTNQREHFRARHARTDAQRTATRRRWPGWEGGPLLVVRLTRVAPRTLDSDNLGAALKSVRDEVCACLRVDDATPLVRWEYRQEKGSEVVRVEVAWGEAPAAVLGALLHRLSAQGDALLAADSRVVDALPVVEASAPASLRVVREPGAGAIRAPRPKAAKSLSELATSASHPAKPRGGP